MNTATETLLIQKGCRYSSIKPYQIGTRSLGEKSHCDGTTTEIKVPVYRILAGQKEVPTILIMFQSCEKNWVLEAETVEGNALLDVFFAYRKMSKEQIKEEILEWLNEGFEIVQNRQGYVSYKR